jgi:hypothetical protein
MCLFGIRKVGQQKTLFSQRKHFPVKEKFGLVSRKVFFLLAVFVFRKVVSGKSLSKLLLKTNLKARHLPL